MRSDFTVLDLKTSTVTVDWLGYPPPFCLSGQRSFEGLSSPLHKTTWKREFKLPWREAGPSNYLDVEVDSDQQVVSKELSLSGAGDPHGGVLPACARD